MFHAFHSSGYIKYIELEIYIYLYVYIYISRLSVRLSINLLNWRRSVQILISNFQGRNAGKNLEKSAGIYQYKKDYFRFQFLISTKLSNSIDPPIHGNKKKISINSFYIWFLVLIYTTTTAVKLILSLQVTVKLLHYITAQFTLLSLIKTCIVIYSRLSDPLDVSWR